MFGTSRKTKSATTRPVPSSVHASRHPTLWHLLGVLILLGAGVHAWPGTGAASPAEPPPVEVDVSPLTRELDILLGNEPGVYGVVVMTPDGETLYSRNRDVPFVAASLFKLVVMATVFEREAAQELTREETLPGWGTIADALFAMIVHSDNGSADVLIERVGGISAINETAERLGLDHTRLNADAGWLDDVPNDPNRDSTNESIRQGKEFVAATAGNASVDVTTPDDMARFFRLLLAGQMINADASDAMLELLSQQEITDRLPVLLPPDAVVAHKTGNLPGVIHDTGIISTPAGPLIVAALTEAMPAEGRAFVVIQQLALIVYENAERQPRWKERPT